MNERKRAREGARERKPAKEQTNSSHGKSNQVVSSDRLYVFWCNLSLEYVMFWLFLLCTREGNKTNKHNYTLLETFRIKCSYTFFCVSFERQKVVKSRCCTCTEKKHREREREAKFPIISYNFCVDINCWDLMVCFFYYFCVVGVQYVSVASVIKLDAHLSPSHSFCLRSVFLFRVIRWFYTVQIWFMCNKCKEDCCVCALVRIK